MAARYATSLRSSRAQAIIDAAGTNPKLKFYNGTVPSAGGTPAGTLLATITQTGALGTQSNGVITFNTTITQSNASHVNGTPTFCRITTSADGFVADIDIGSGAGNMQFTGTIQNGVNVILNASTNTEGNA
jgi:hypothetical protein